MNTTRALGEALLWGIGVAVVVGAIGWASSSAATVVIGLVLGAVIFALHLATAQGDDA